MNKRLFPIVVVCLLGTLELLRGGDMPTEIHSFANVNHPIPDGNPVGLSDVRFINSSVGSISSMRVKIQIAGEYNGDLYGYLRHAEGFCVLFNRVGRTILSSSGYSDSGIDVILEDGAIGDIHLYRDLDVPNASSPLTGRWQPDGRNVDPDMVVDTSSRTTSLAVFTGLDPNGQWTLFLADLESGGTNMLVSWEVEFSGVLQPSLAWASPEDIVYGTALDGSQLNAAAVYDSTNVPGVFVYDPPAGTLLNAGSGQTLSVSFTPADPSTFLPVTTTVSLNVLRKLLIVAAEDKNKVYGQALPVFTATYDGFIDGEGPEHLDTPVQFAADATDASAVGLYAITPFAADANYNILAVDGILTIEQAGTSGMLVSSSNPALPGAEVTFTMTVSALAPGAGIPTGLVEFIIDGAPAASRVLSGGAATFTTTTLAAGAHLVAADYSGDLNFVGSSAALDVAQIINTPPVAGADEVERYPTNAVKVSVATLLANDSDGDGDLLVFVDVSPNSANGGSVVLDGDWVRYIPAAGDTGADSFSYAISDGWGDPIIGTVAVTIKVDDDPSLNLTVTDLGDGSYQLDFAGIPGRTYIIQYSETIEPVLWQDLSVATAAADGTYQYVDTPPAGTTQWSYRAVYYPPAP